MRARLRLVVATLVAVGLAMGQATASAGPLTRPLDRAPKVRFQLYKHPRLVCPNGASSVDLHAARTWSPEAARAYLVNCNLVVERGARLVLEPGTVVELAGSSIYLAPGSSLEADGTAAAPVVFTSAPGQGYNQVLGMDGQASVHIYHADFELGSSGLGASAVVAEGPLSAGCTAQGSDTLVVKSSVVGAPVTMGQCSSSTAGSHYWLSGDRFEHDATFSLSGDPVDSVHLSSNSFTFDAHASSLTAINLNDVPVQGVDLSGPASNTFKSSAGRVTVSLANASIAPSRSWAFASPDGAALTGQVMVQGTASFTSGSILVGTSLTMGSHGSIVAQGTDQDPVRFTSGSSVQVTGSGSLLVDHAHFGDASGYDIYEGSCTGDGTEHIIIKRSEFVGLGSSGDISLGSCDTSGNADISVTGNLLRAPLGFPALSVTVPGAGGPENTHPGSLVIRSNVFDPTSGPNQSTPQPELELYGWPVRGLDLEGAETNRFVGRNEGRVVDVSDGLLPAGTSWQVSPAGREVLELQTDYFDRPGIVVGGRLVLDPGLIVKVGITRGLAGGIGVGFGISLGNSGALQASGTAARPVIFTSMTDDTVGGESYGHPSVTTQHDYEEAVSLAEGSHVDVDHAIFRHGWYAFDLDCGPKPTGGGTFSVNHSLVQAEVALGDCDGTQHGYVPRLRADVFRFNGSADANFAAGGGYDPSALQPAVLLYNIDPTGLALSGSGSNLFKGSGAGRVVALSGTTVPKGATWTVSANTGVVLAAWPDLDYLTNPGITVEGTLVLKPGTVVKSGTGGIAVDVASFGDLDAAGTTGDPVIFTSIADGSRLRGGDSNGVSKPLAPRPGAYGTAVQFESIDNGSALDHDIFAFANVAINVKQLDHFTVSHSDFVDNVAAFDVEGSEDNDPVLAKLPCVPPWLSFMKSSYDWYGPSGHPAPDINLGSFGGVVVPSLFAQVFRYLKTEINESVPLFGGENSVPWAIYSCPPALIPPFPVTPIDFTITAPGQNFPRVDPKYVALPN